MLSEQVTSQLAVGDYLVDRGCPSRLVRIERADEKQVWGHFPTGDPGSVTALLTAAPRWCVTPAVPGETVCREPWRSCWCPLPHLDERTLAWFSQLSAGGN